MNNINIGDKCLITYKIGIYDGLDSSGDHHVKVDNKIVISKEVLPYVEPTHKFYKRADKVYIFDSVTAWGRDGKLSYVYKFLIPSDTFRGYDHIYPDELLKYEPLDSDPFLSDDEVTTQLNQIDEEIYPLQVRIDDLQRDINEIKKRKQPIYAKAKRQWVKTDEKETGKNFLGTSIETTYECQLTGEVVTRYSTALN